MHEFPAYQVLSTLYESDNTVVYRAKTIQNNLPVIQKVLKSDVPSSRESVRYKQEYKILQNLSDIPGVIKAYDIEEFENSLLLILEDFGAESLKNILKKKRLSLGEILPIASQIVTCLGDIHSANVIHKNINPTNIVVNEADYHVKVIDFGISTVLSKENLILGNPEILEGTLAYISPEQTGRMNRAVDFRTDFYALGATLYEMLVGKIPFEIKDPLETIHFHIAKLPTEPIEIDNQIPQTVSDIVMKLLAKAPEDRYQSCFGLKYDIDECLRQITINGKISDFSIGQQDVSDRLIIPQKLYGRDKEIDALLSGFENVAKGNRELMLVSGRPGIGKTALVQEVYKPMTKHHGFFISGKFDQFERNNPYTALIRAFRQLTRYLLTETEEQIKGWRQKIHEALTPNDQVMIDLIPELGLIIGEQPPLNKLPPAESQNRFTLVLQKMFGVFAKPEHPLILFFDDLQWADAASLNLISILMTSTDNLCLYCIGAFRENEVNDTHPLMFALKEIQNSDLVVNRISLKPLGKESINQLIADTLHCSPEQSLPLAELVLKKTEGNPFFINEFLESLYIEGLVSFDTNSGSWHWHSDQISAKGTTANVIELMAGKIQKLDTDTQKVLTLAAYLGNQFDLETLALSNEKSIQETQESLFPAISSGLIIPLSDVYKSIEFESRPCGRGSNVEFRFSHDRIQQATYSLVPPEKEASIHLKIGRLLLERQPPETDDNRLFDIVNHLNSSTSIIESQKERIEFAELNLLAGKKAMSSAAYDHALTYLTSGKQLVGADGWSDHYDLMFAITQEAAESALLNAEFDLMMELTSEIFQNTKTTIEKAKSCQIRIKGYTAQHQLKKAVITSLTYLNELGIRLPKKTKKLQVILSLVKTKMVLLGKNIEDLIDLPDMTDKRMDSAIVIMRHTATPSYYSNPNLMALLIFKQVQMVIKHGLNTWSASIFASFGLSLCGVVGDIETGYRLGKLALKLLDKHPDTKQVCRTMFVVNTFVRHWKEALPQTLHPLQKAYRIGLDNGDFEWGSLCGHLYCEHQFFLGKELNALENEIGSYSQAIGQLKQASQLSYNETFRQVTLNLLGRSKDPTELSGEAFDEETTLPWLEDIGDKTGVFAIHFTKTLLNYLFRRYDTAFECAQKAEVLAGSVPGMFAVTRHNLFDSLTRIKKAEESDNPDRKSLLKKVARNQRKLKKWAKHAPTNHLHLFYLVEAECLRISGKDLAAGEHYDRAISMAISNRFPSDLALAFELAGEYYFNLDKIYIAKTYLHESVNAYSKWGCLSKVKDIKIRYADLLSQQRSGTDLIADSTISETSTHVTQPGRFFDFGSVIKASQSISGQIVLSDLLKNLMMIVIENAGAEKGFLILRDGDHLMIEAQITLGTDHNIRIETIPLDDCPDLSSSVVRFVKRTNEVAVFSDITKQGAFSNDTYINKNHPKSVLCFPIMHHGNLFGILYLENNKAPNVFTQDRVEVLRVLASQAAISINNSKLYNTLEQALREVKQSSKAKNEFLARTSHELRTPLNSIINFPEGLLNNFVTVDYAHCQNCNSIFELESDDTIDDDTVCAVCQSKGKMAIEQGHEYTCDQTDIYKGLQAIRRSGRHLLHVVDDILDYNKLEQGSTKLRREQLHLAPLLVDIAESMNILANQRQINLDLSNVPNDVQLYADRVKIEQIMFNLISNAIKFASIGSTVPIAGKVKSSKIVLSVSDSGIGIPKEHIERIFDSFYQVEGGAIRQFGGSGLGLAIVKNLVELHEGTIWVESTLDKGSTFFVELPRFQQGAND